MQHSLTVNTAMQERRVWLVLQPARRKAQQKKHGPLTAKPARSTGSRISRLILGERLAKATHDSAERVIRQTGSSVTALRGLGIGLNLQGCVADVGSRIAIHATRDAIRVLRRRRLCVDERRQGGDKTPAGLGQRATTQTHSAVFLAVSTCLAEVAAIVFVARERVVLSGRSSRA